MNSKMEMDLGYVVATGGIVCSVVAAIMGNWLALSASISVVFLSVILMCETLKKNFADLPNTNDFEGWWNAAGKSDARFLIFIGMRSRKYIAKAAWAACKKAHLTKQAGTNGSGRMIGISTPKEFYHGYAACASHIAYDQDMPTLVEHAMKDHGITLEDLQKADCDVFDLERLEEALDSEVSMEWLLVDNLSNVTKGGSS